MESSKLFRTVKTRSETKTCKNCYHAQWIHFTCSGRYWIKCDTSRLPNLGLSSKQTASCPLSHGIAVNKYRASFFLIYIFFIADSIIDASHSSPLYPPPLSPSPSTAGLHPTIACVHGPLNWLVSLSTCAVFGQNIGNTQMKVRSLTNDKLLNSPNLC